MNQRTAFLSLAIVLLITLSIPQEVISQEVNFDYRFGPFLDKIVYERISDPDEQMLALQEDEIDIVSEMMDPKFLDRFGIDDGTEVAISPNNGYPILYFNTEKYPFNITLFRRAVAIALDKEEICDSIWNGLAVPQDCPVPLGNPYSAEDMLDYNYYQSDLESGNSLLDSIGFEDLNDDGFREDSMGNPLNLIIEVPMDGDVFLEMGEFVRDTFIELGVNTTVIDISYIEFFIGCPICASNYDMVLTQEQFQDLDVRWLSTEFTTDSADEHYTNFANFRNATYDAWCDPLVNSTDYNEVYNAAIELQKIWTYECPGIVLCQNQRMFAYRNDRFEGFVNDLADGIPCWWTNYKAHLKDEFGGPFGGTLRWSNKLDPQSFNFMVTTDESTWNILMELYDSLIRRHPEGHDIPWLAHSYYIETHDDNPTIPDGHTRITFDLHRTILWTDTRPLTAEDVAFSLNYYRDAPGNPYGKDLSMMTAAYSRNESTVIVEFGTESIWHLHTVGYKPIIPKHVFQEIGVDGWNLWNPNPPREEMVTSGPFNVSDYVAGEFVELQFTYTYFFGGCPYCNNMIIFNTTTTTDPSNFFPFNLDLNLAITLVSTMVILIVLIIWKREKVVVSQ
ncbi:MAG: ABC transporter substrate-binding protein [Candidatus Thorarchaeota archaeon]